MAAACHCATNMLAVKACGVKPCPPLPYCHPQPQQLSLPVCSFPSSSSQDGPCLQLTTATSDGTSPSSQAIQPAAMGTLCSHWEQPRQPLPNIPISSRKWCGSLWQWGKGSVLPVLLSSLFADLPPHSVSPLISQEGSRNTQNHFSPEITTTWIKTSRNLLAV